MLTNECINECINEFINEFINGGTNKRKTNARTAQIVSFQAEGTGALGWHYLGNAAADHVRTTGVPAALLVSMIPVRPQRAI